MRVLMLSKACVVGIYQRKLEHIAAQGVDLMLAVPPSWRDERGETPLERVFTAGYTLTVTPIRFNGNFHLHYYPAFPQLVRTFQPDVVHIDEEPYNLATWHALWHARRTGAKALVFGWQNIVRHYPPPFNLGERWTLGKVQYALAGTESAADVLRTKGYSGPLAVVPQFGTDPDLFQPVLNRPDRPFTVGYVGRLVHEKGVDLLLHALAALPGDWQARIVGSGPQSEGLQRMAAELGIADRVIFIPWVASTEMPAQFHTMDVIAVPSRTLPNWKEQFGRVMVEAMASGIPVIGSDSGAIPNVLGEAGTIVPEDDASALTSALATLRDDRAQAAALAAAGRARVLAHFTHEQVAAQTVAAYAAMMGEGASAEAHAPEAVIRSKSPR